MDLNENLTQIILAIIAAIVGITITIRIVKKSRIKKNSGFDNSYNVTIKENKVKGDVAGRDIVKKNDK